MLDQALSSGTNFLGAALAAGLLTASGFGAFAVASSVLIITVGVGRSISGSLLMIQAPGSSMEGSRRLLADAAATAAALGLFAGALVTAAGLVIGGDSGTALAFLGPVIPVVLVQDAYRHHALATERPSVACRNDGAWLATAVIGLVALRALDLRTVPGSILVAHGGAAVGIASVLSAQWTAPTRRSVADWLGERVGAAVRLVADFLLAVSYSVVPLIIVMAINADLEQAAGLKVAQTLMGPLTVVFAASTLYLQPTMVRARTNIHQITSLAVRQSLTNLTISVIWLATVLLLSDGIGTQLFGESWYDSEASAMYLGLAFFGLAISSGPLTALRSAGLLTENFIAQAFVASVVLIATPVSGLVFEGGLLIGFAVGNLAGSVVPWAVMVKCFLRRR